VRAFLLLAAFGLTACASSKPFMPQSDYPPDPWVKGYAGVDDCLGGEQLAAREFELPKYPRKPHRTGRQGWVILRLDVNAVGETRNVITERSLPEGMFSGSAKKAARRWVFEPPKDGPMLNCRVLVRYRLGVVTVGG
jgi:TonB family protein